MNFIKKRNLPELLAPAGSFEHLKAAVAAGADAIYMGGESLVPERMHIIFPERI